MNAKTPSYHGYRFPPEIISLELALDEFEEDLDEMGLVSPDESLAAQVGGKGGTGGGVGYCCIIGS